jgi:hypothetical protein
LSNLCLSEKILKNIWLFALVACLGVTACSEKKGTTAEAGAPAVASTAPNVGEILQLAQSGGYTYAEVKTGNGQVIWMAGSPLQLKVGDRVQWGDYAVMRNFSSKGLGRTFDQILFVNGWGPVGGILATVAPHGSQPGVPTSASVQPMPAIDTADSAVQQGIVRSVETAGGYTYLEVDVNGAAVWIAVPRSSAKAGDRVRWSGGSVMQNFAAKSLGRTFDQIIFAGGVSVVQ